METDVKFSPARQIYKLFGEYEKRGMGTQYIHDAIAHVTGTEGMSNKEILEKWKEEIISRDVGF